MLFLYRFSIWFYGFAIGLAAPFRDKARKFRDGRKNLFKELETAFAGRSGRLVWVHAASLGEFEQGRPVIEALKQQNPDTKVLLTFFSPSGFEVRKNYPLADYVFYLPLDTRTNAGKFVEIVKPDLAVFIKYEFWYYFLKELGKRDIPALLVSGIFRESQLFFHSSGKFFLPVLQQINHYFVQDETSGKLLDSIGIGQHTVAGDTRFDRVIDVAKEAKEIPIAGQFKGGEKVMVLGSVWPSDMERLKPFILEYVDQMKFIIAPHNIGEGEVMELLQLPESIRFSEATGKNLKDKRVLIIDNMGMLSSLYRYGDFAVIGGAFRGTLHNTLEAAVYGVPVFFGAHASNVKFIEAAELVQSGGGYTFATTDELKMKFRRLWKNESAYKRSATASRDFVYGRSGATHKVVAKIKELL